MLIDTAHGKRLTVHFAYEKILLHLFIHFFLFNRKDVSIGSSAFFNLGRFEKKKERHQISVNGHSVYIHLCICPPL